MFNFNFSKKNGIDLGTLLRTRLRRARGLIIVGGEELWLFNFSKKIDIDLETHLRARLRMGENRFNCQKEYL